MSILICAQNFDMDPHINRVCHYINKHKGDYFFYERYRDDNFFSFELGDNDEAQLTLENDEKELTYSKNFNSVYWRIKPVISSEIPFGELNKAEKFCSLQWLNALKNLWFFSKSETLWVNDLDANKKAESKIMQLFVAKKIGLHVPRTIVTNDIKKVENFMEENPDAIFKLLSPFMSETKNIFTNKLTKEMLQKSSSEKSVTMAPMIYQESINKEYEIRITIVDKEIFALRIDSIDRTDWRKDQRSEMFKEVEIPEDLKNKLLAFQEAFNLRHASYDFIFDQNGNYVFLECNSAGQWYFNEDIGEKIAEKMALLLLHKLN